jgi:hypothetical protein
LGILRNIARYLLPIAPHHFDLREGDVRHAAERTRFTRGDLRARIRPEHQSKRSEIGFHSLFALARP